jgi:SAM-dependent methyltransferase
MERMLEETARAEDAHFWFIGLRRNARQLLEAALAGKTSLSILDCGAGTGRNLDWLSDYGRATGIELTPTALDVARAHRRPVVQATVRALPIADQTMDLVTSFDVLYCLDDETEARAIAEMRRVLKPGGLVLVNVAALDMLRGAHSSLTHEVRRYTRQGLSVRLARGGFRIERMTFTNATLFPVALVKRGLERLTGRAAESSDDLHVPPAPVNALFNAVSAAEAAWLRIANLPIGTSILAVARKI